MAAITKPGEDTPIGVLTYLLDGRRHTATISWVALAPGARRLGLGQDAVRLFEEAATRRGVRTFRATVDSSNGLALYFWLRLGYRPLDIRDWGMAMIREIGLALQEKGA
jgi:ribosomal protein S18 acetylase RimI-like enzyme